MWDKKLCIIGLGCVLPVLNASSLAEDYAGLCIEDSVTESEVDYDELDCFRYYEELVEKILKKVEALKNCCSQIGFRDYEKLVEKILKKLEALIYYCSQICSSYNEEFDEKFLKIVEALINYCFQNCFSDYKELDEKILKKVEALINYRSQILIGDMSIEGEEKNLKKMENAKKDLETQASKLKEILMVLKGKRTRSLSI